MCLCVCVCVCVCLVLGVGGIDKGTYYSFGMCSI